MQHPFPGCFLFSRTYNDKPMETEPEYHGLVEGEDVSTDMRNPFARHFNRRVKKMSDNTVADIPGFGEVPVNKIRLRGALEEGHLRMYIRQEAKDPKVIIPATVIALGLVATAVHKLKHRQK